MNKNEIHICRDCEYHRDDNTAGWCKAKKWSSNLLHKVYYCDKFKLIAVKYPMCPINIYWEGDEDKCDVSKCDFEDRMCSQACERGNDMHDNEKQKQYGHPEFYKLLEQMAELHSRKNHDYAGTKDPLKNLRAPQRIGILPFVGVMVRLQDKWSRLEEFINSGMFLVKDESVEDTLMDNAVYSLLAIILYREEQKKSEGCKNDEGILITSN